MLKDGIFTDGFEILFTQLFAWIIALPVFIMNADLTHYGIAIAIYIIMMVCGMTMMYHKYWCHNKRKNNYKLPRWVEVTGTLIATYAHVGSSIAWCAQHLKHHAFTDTDKDPHSPHNDGFFKTQFLSMYGPKPELKYVAHMLKDPLHVNLHKLYTWIHLILFVVAIFLLPPVWAATLYFIPQLLIWNFGSLVNTLSHMIGYRTYDTKDTSTNNLFVGWTTLGEWHNNHHGNATDHNYGKRWWEFDASYHLIEWLRIK